MKTVWIASLAIAASTSAFAQSTIYKHVDESGRITYTNRPMKGAVAMELEPLTAIPGTPAGMLTARPVPVADKATNGDRAANGDKAEAPAKNESLAASARPAVAVVTPVSQRPSLAAVEPTVQRKRDSDRRRILEEELVQEEQSLTGARTSLQAEQQNPQLVAAVRMAQQATDPTAAHHVSSATASGQGIGTHPRPASHRRRAREEHRGAQERSRRLKPSLEQSLFRHPLLADAPAFQAGALLLLLRRARRDPYPDSSCCDRRADARRGAELTYANPAAETLFAHGRKHLIGAPCRARASLSGRRSRAPAPAVEAESGSRERPGPRRGGEPMHCIAWRASTRARTLPTRRRP